MKTWIELNGQELSICLACATCQDATPSAMLNRDIVCAKCHDASRNGLDWDKIIRDVEALIPHCVKCGALCAVCFGKDRC